MRTFRKILKPVTINYMSGSDPLELDGISESPRFGSNANSGTIGVDTLGMEPHPHSFRGPLPERAWWVSRVHLSDVVYRWQRVAKRVQLNVSSRGATLRPLLL